MLHEIGRLLPLASYLHHRINTILHVVTRSILGQKHYQQVTLYMIHHLSQKTSRSPWKVKLLLSIFSRQLILTVHAFELDFLLLDLSYIIGVIVFTLDQRSGSFSFLLRF
jgi:hypothetical protein